MLRRPCTFEQMQNEWPKLMNRLKDLESGGGGGSAQTAIATANWHRGGGTPYVLTDVGTVYFPIRSWADPNVVAGQVIDIIPRAGGGLLAIDCLDAKIGTSVDWDLLSGDIPEGWAIQDGVANASGNGGTGINKIGTYCKWSSTAGTQAGTDSYTPTGTVAEHTMTGNLFGDVTYVGTESVDVMFDFSDLVSDAISIDNHVSHHHHIDYLAYDVEVGTGTTIYTLEPGHIAGHSVTTNEFDVDTELNESIKHLDEGGDIYARFTGASSYETTVDIDKSAWDTTVIVPYELVHDHNWTGDEMVIDLPHTTTIPIERLANYSG